MNEPENSSVLLNSIGQTPSMPPSNILSSRLNCWIFPFSIKEGLKSGELAVPGDQWPIFLWDKLKYDPDDAWNGFLKNPLLVTVCIWLYIYPETVT